MGVSSMNKRQKEGYKLQRRTVAAAQQGNLNETMTLLHTIQTDFPGEIHQDSTYSSGIISGSLSRS